MVLTTRSAGLAILIGALTVGCSGTDGTETGSGNQESVTTASATVSSQPDSTTTQPQSSTTSTTVEAAQVTLQDVACGAGRWAVVLVSDEHGRSSAACGEDDAGHRVEVGDVFPIWSATKMVTAATVMTLVDDGLIDLDAPLATYIDFEIDDALTMRHLLTHTSGMREAGWDCDAAKTLESIKTAAAEGQVAEPGEVAEYSTSGFMLASHVVAAVAGDDAADVYRRQVFEPLGMHDTYFMATEEGPTPRGRQYDDADTCPGTTVTLGGGGDLASTVEDLKRFAVGLFDGPLLTATSLSDLLERQSEVFGIPYGLGNGRIDQDDTGRSLYGHWGTTDFEAGVMHDPETGTTIAVIVSPNRFLNTVWQVADWATSTTQRDQ